MSLISFHFVLRKRGTPTEPSWKRVLPLFQEDVTQMKGKVHATTRIRIGWRWRKGWSCLVDDTLRQEANRSTVPWHHTALCSHCPRCDSWGGSGADGQCLADHYHVWLELSDQSSVRSCPCQFWCWACHLRHIGDLSICTALCGADRRGRVHLCRGFLPTTAAYPACFFYRPVGSGSECDLRSLWVPRPGSVAATHGRTLAAAAPGIHSALPGANSRGGHTRCGDDLNGDGPAAHHCGLARGDVDGADC